ncbi:uncharacterized protein CELE_F22E5.22 [Caenorhabditis elegans]|nr:Uncharacterized protein CELE_F22E5.22 [Caenorhabditis elegans]CAA0059152.1 Uncharacterized protein CELE_F22E5.22 [Caenorhabditis elegans]
MRTVPPEDVYISITLPYEDFTTESNEIAVTTDSSTVPQLVTETTEIPTATTTPVGVYVTGAPPSGPICFNC